MTRAATLTVPLPDQFLADVLTTAVEGGITYWVERADSVERAGRDDPAFEHLSVLAVHGIVCIEGHAEGQQLDVDLDTVARGISLLLGPDSPVNATIRRYVQYALDDLRRGGDDATYAAGHIDADAADCIVQAGLFGEVAFG